MMIIKKVTRDSEDDMDTDTETEMDMDMDTKETKTAVGKIRFSFDIFRVDA